MSADGDSSESEDRISSLPDDLIDFILSFLSDDLDVVVRTSVLSRSWKTHWTRVRKLVFNLKVLKKNLKQTDPDVVSCIESVLSRHDGPVNQFSLSADSKSIRDHISDLDVLRWFQILVQKQICEIFISERSHWKWESFHLQFFRCSTLTHLTLRECQFGSTTDFGGFPNLLDLHLDRVSMPKSLLQSIISGSPLLRVLDLIYTADNYEGPVLINAPRIRSLSLRFIEGICLKEYPDLTCAHLTCLDSDMLYFEKIGHWRKCDLDRFNRSMPRVQRLMLDSEALAHFSEDGIPTKFPNALQSLEELEIVNLDSLRELTNVFCLLRNSPNLQSLSIYVDVLDLNDYTDNDWEVRIRYCEAQEKAGIMTSLSEVTFYQLYGTNYEMLLIKTLIHCCPMLKTINIVSDNDIHPENEVWMFKELLDAQYPISATIILEPRYVNEGRRLLICHLL